MDSQQILDLGVGREPAGTSFLARLYGYHDGDGNLVDEIHPSLGLFKAPLAACYKGDFPTGDVKILLQTTSSKHPHLKESLPMQVLDMIESRRVEEFDFFMVASDISRVQLADKGNVNVLHHPWCYPNTKFKGKDSGNWHMGAYTFAGIPGVYPTKPKVDLAFQTTGAMRVSVHSQKYGMACSPNNARVSLFPPPISTSTSTPTPTTTTTAPKTQDPVRAFVSLAIEDCKTRPRCCVTLHWWFLDASIVKSKAYSTWLSRFDQVVASAQTIGDLVSQLTTISNNCGDVNLETACAAVVSTLLPCVGVEPKWLHTQLQSAPVPTQRGSTSTAKPAKPTATNSSAKTSTSKTRSPGTVACDPAQSKSVHQQHQASATQPSRTHPTKTVTPTPTTHTTNTNTANTSSATRNNTSNTISADVQNDNNSNTNNTTIYSNNSNPNNNNSNNNHGAGDDDDFDGGDYAVAVAVVGTNPQLTRAQKRNGRRKEIRKKQQQQHQ
eukprot:m.160406 g.160406  ORF g.160406 m.160406 type:complete len:495 (-) comp31181_c2_seq3:33-1517(-)